MKIAKPCPTCGKSFSSYPSQKKVYCSFPCYTRTGTNNSNWRRGDCVISGYRYIYAPEHPQAIKMGYVAEHRLVMERKLGRPLDASEIVHHRDGNKLNNKVRNLVICRSHSEHAAEHNKTRVRDSRGRFTS
jgi:hypothetical protein